MAGADDERSPTKRQQGAEARRQAILEAGLDVFASAGFEAARLDDVAAKAGVAKGTIYLSFRDKEHLFEEIILGEVAPVLAVLDATSAVPDIPTGILLGRIFEIFQTQILATKRKEIARLIIKEGARFPHIAEIYHREVIAKVAEIVSKVMRRGMERGEISSDTYARHPHLIMAPMVLAIIWDGLFSSIAPLDVDALLEAHKHNILRETNP
jgi:AcrR family transcriptional regulator